jgi:hypothetical protein
MMGRRSRSSRRRQKALSSEVLKNKENSAQDTGAGLQRNQEGEREGNENYFHLPISTTRIRSLRLCVSVVIMYFSSGHWIKAAILSLALCKQGKQRGLLFNEQVGNQLFDINPSSLNRRMPFYVMRRKWNIPFRVISS